MRLGLTWCWLVNGRRRTPAVFVVDCAADSVSCSSLCFDLLWLIRSSGGSIVLLGLTSSKVGWLVLELSHLPHL